MCECRTSCLTSPPGCAPLRGLYPPYRQSRRAHQTYWFFAPQEVADQLADAIEAEIRELGGGQLLEEAAAMHLQKVGK